MTIRIYQNLNNYIVEVDQQQHLQPLADFIMMSTSTIRPIEIRYSYATGVGVILCDRNEDTPLNYLEEICNNYRKYIDINIVRTEQ
jgi:hypothetical protein